MGFQKVCTLDDVWAGEMDVFEVEGTEVLVVHSEDGVVEAVQAKCPHQDIELVEGELCGNTLTCRMHLWQFDICSGKGVNPAHAEIAKYPVKLEGEDVFVDVVGIEPKHTHS